jgi:hypothetical protein
MDLRRMPSERIVSSVRYWICSKLMLADQPRMTTTPRKDLNMRLTHKLIFKAVPKVLKPHHFTAVKEVVLSASVLGSYLESRGDDGGYQRHPNASDGDDTVARDAYVRRVQFEQGADAREIGRFTRALKPTEPSARAITITVQVSDTMNQNKYISFRPNLFFHRPSSSSFYVFPDVPLHNDYMFLPKTLILAYLLRGVVHFNDDALSHREPNPSSLSQVGSHGCLLGPTPKSVEHTCPGFHHSSSRPRSSLP